MLDIMVTIVYIIGVRQKESLAKQKAERQMEEQRWQSVRSVEVSWWKESEYDLETPREKSTQIILLDLV